MTRTMTRIAARDDRGLGLVELVVAMAVSLLVLGMVGALFAQVARVASDSQIVRTANGAAANVMNELRRELVATADVATSTTPASGVVVAAPNLLIVTSYADSTSTSTVPTLVAFAVNSSGYLTETRITGTLSSGYYVFTGTASTRTVAGPLTGTSTLFAYLDASGNTLVPATATASATQQAALTATGRVVGTGTLLLSDAQLPQVAQVQVTAQVAAQLSSGSNPVQLKSIIGMPNLALANGGS